MVVSFDLQNLGIEHDLVMQQLLCELAHILGHIVSRQSTTGVEIMRRWRHLVCRETKLPENVVDLQSSVYSLFRPLTSSTEVSRYDLHVEAIL